MSAVFRKQQGRTMPVIMFHYSIRMT